MDVTLKIYSATGVDTVPLDGSRLTIGRDTSAGLTVDDDGLSRIHASIHRDGERLWVLDEGSTNGTFVNGKAVPPSGTPLADGDEVTMGNQTSIAISFGSPVAAYAVSSATGQSFQTTTSTLPANPVSSTKIAIIFACVVILTAVGALGVYALRKGDGKSRRVTENADVSSTPAYSPPASPAQTQSSPAMQVSNETTPTPATDGIKTPEATATQPVDPGGQTAQTSGKLYLQMTPQEQVDFIEREARHISMMMGNRPYSFNDDVIRLIKQYVDGYARRVGNNSGRLWGEDLRFMFARAREQYAPYIIRAFNSRGVPPVVGLYLVVIETEYHNIQRENSAGAAGLFQFIGPTARGYGVDPSERTNVAKMAPAAAAYMSDRIAEFGPDSMSVALGIAGYNRSPDSVRRDLHDVLNTSNPERSFWSLVMNSKKLDKYFQGENIKYVPKFFAAAIVGENPWSFGLQMQALSTYTEIKGPPDTGN